MANPEIIEPRRAEPRMPVIENPYAREEPMPASATGTLFVAAAGFGIGALLIVFGFVFLVGIGDLGHNAATSQTPAAQSVATAPVAPGPAPKPVQNTSGPAVPQTTGQAPAPANPATPRAPTAQEQKSK